MDWLGLHCIYRFLLVWVWAVYISHWASPFPLGYSVWSQSCLVFLHYHSRAHGVWSDYFSFTSYISNLALFSWFVLTLVRDLPDFTDFCRLSFGFLSLFIFCFQYLLTLKLFFISYLFFVAFFFLRWKLRSLVLDISSLLVHAIHALNSPPQQNFLVYQHHMLYFLFHLPQNNF